MKLLTEHFLELSESLFIQKSLTFVKRFVLTIRLDYIEMKEDPIK